MQDTPTTAPSAGVMDADYARGRLEKLYLSYRLRVRALVAVSAYRRMAGQTASTRVLELGAAEGLTLLEMRRLLGGHGEFVGVELSDGLLAAAPELPDDTRLVRGDVTSLPDEVGEEPFDLCTALALLEHLSDPLSCVEQAYRALRGGGVFVATCPHPIWDTVAGALGMVKDDHHESKITLDTLAAMAREAGFSQVETRPFMWAPTGFLPYLDVDLDPGLSLQVDALVHRLRVLDATFVNQALFAKK